MSRLVSGRAGLAVASAVPAAALIVHSVVSGTGVGATILLALAAALLTLCGAPTWLVIAPGRSLLGIPIGLTIGLALVGLGVWLESIVGLYGLRWAALAAGALFWIPVLRAGRFSREDRSSPERRTPGHSGVAWAVGAASAAMLVAAAVYSSQAQLDGAVTYYVDLPWHIANAGEAAGRVPAVHPTIPDVPLSFGWLYAGIYGWASTFTTIPAATIVTTTAPIASALLIPALVAVVAHLVTRSPVAAALAPLLFAVSRGPILSLTPSTDLTPLWISTNRDLANVLVLAVLALVIVLPRTSGAGRVVTTSAVLLVVTFVACGVKGSSAPIVLGAAGLVWLWSFWRRRGRTATTVGLAAVLLAVVVQQIAVTKTSGNSVIAPLTFQRLLPPELNPALAATFVALVLVGMIIATAVGATWSRSLNSAIGVIGASIAGLLGIALFDHPGLSQLYFLHGAWPAYVIGFAIVLAAVVSRWGARVLLSLPVTGLAFGLAASLSATGSAKVWLGVLVAAAALSTAVAAALVASSPNRQGWRFTLVAGLCLACVGFQYWGLPRVETAPATSSVREDLASVTEDQRRVLEELRESSDPSDLVMTNRHCRTGSLDAGDCDPRWFTVSAFSERRVVVEGYGYSPFSAGSPVDDEYWDMQLLEANDSFLSAPSSHQCERFADLGVTWIYIDKRAPWSADLAAYAEQVADTRDSALYRLDSSCR